MQELGTVENDIVELPSLPLFFSEIFYASRYYINAFIDEKWKNRPWMMVVSELVS